jgi:hypothetical protein
VDGGTLRLDPRDLLADPKCPIITNVISARVKAPPSDDAGDDADGGDDAPGDGGDDDSGTAEAGDADPKG